MDISNLVVLFLLIIFGFFVLYFRGRKYLEHFISFKDSIQPVIGTALSNHDDNHSKRFEPDGKPKDKLNTTIKPPEMPYLMDPIDNIDDYEVSAVYQRQGSKEASKAQLNQAMTRYPIDWSVQGPNSQYFQEKQATYEKETAAKDNTPPTISLYQHIDDSDRAIPDTASQEDEERKLLQTYEPKNSKGLLQYSVQDVKHLLHKVYDKKGLIPVIEKSKQGENIWEVVEVKEKNPKIVWEDDVKKVERDIMTQRGEEVIEVPYATTDLSASLDPFFQPRDRVANNKNDYTQWTPGLERMFAPTYPVKSWF